MRLSSLAAAFVAAIMMTLSPVLAATPDATARTGITIVPAIGVIGDAFGPAARTDRQRQERAVVDGQPVRAGDYFLTGNEAGMTIAFPDGGKLTLDRYSWIEIISYRWDGKTGENVVRLNGGAYRWIGGAMQPGGVRFLTPTAEITTSGTTQVMIVNPDGSTNDGVWEGGNKVRNLSDNKWYDLPAGTGATFTVDGVKEMVGFEPWDAKKVEEEWRKHVIESVLLSLQEQLAWLNLYDSGWKPLQAIFSEATLDAIIGSADDLQALIGGMVMMKEGGGVQIGYPNAYDKAAHEAAIAKMADLPVTEKNVKGYKGLLKDIEDYNKTKKEIEYWEQVLGYPNMMKLLPDSYGKPVKAGKGDKFTNPLVQVLGIAVDLPRITAQDDWTLNDMNSVFIGSWEEGLPIEMRTKKIKSRNAIITSLDDLKQNTSAIGSPTVRARPWKDEETGFEDRANQKPIGIFLVSSNNLQETAWAIVEGNEVHYIETASFGPIRSPDGSTIFGVNNAGRQQSVLVKEFKLGDDQRLFSLQGLAKFVTTEYPDFIGSQFNDTAVITLTTPGGQSISITGAQLFGASVNESNFAPVAGLPAPLAGWNFGGDVNNGGGETAWQLIFQRLRVAPGGRVRISITVNNVADTLYPSAALITRLTASGSR